MVFTLYLDLPKVISTDNGFTFSPKSDLKKKVFYTNTHKRKICEKLPMNFMILYKGQVICSINFQHTPGLVTCGYARPYRL